jgi:signal transduction histidine kinase
MIDLSSLEVDSAAPARTEELRELYRAQARLVAAIQDLSLARKLAAIQEIVRHAAREIAGADGVVRRTARPAEVELLKVLSDLAAVATERVRVHDELEQRVAARTAQLEAVNHELESFAYSVSHDLRGPLRAISGFTEFLGQELGTPAPKVREYLAKVQEGAKRMGELIDDLMGLAKVARKPLTPAELDLSDLVRGMAARLREQPPARAVELVVADGLKARGDAGLIAVVFEHLLANAWKYTGKTASPRVEVGAAPAPGGGLAFFVRDNGAGFEPRYADRLFKPFERLHTQSEFPGNGIGLATVQRIVHRHGGRVWAEGKPGEGATFHFTLP